MDRRSQVWGALLLGACGCSSVSPAAAPTGALLKAQVLDGSGNAVGREAFLQRAMSAQLVCLGEQHDDPAHHDMQLALWQLLAAQSEQDGRALALGLEMVQQPFQPAVNDYLQGHLNAKQLAEAVEWPRRWGYDFGFFRPLFHSAHELGADVLALNAPRELTRKVARNGLASLTANERARLPQLDLDDAAHRRFFWEAMGFDTPAGGHDHSMGRAHRSAGGAHKGAGGAQKHAGDAHKGVGGAHKSEHGAHKGVGGAHKGAARSHEDAGGPHEGEHSAHEGTGGAHKGERAPQPHHAHKPAGPHHGGADKQLRFYTAQVIWDESMASAASRWLHQHRDGRLLVLAGNGHCHKSAIVQRVKRRVNVEALSVLMAPRDHTLSKLATRDFLIKIDRQDHEDAAKSPPDKPAPAKPKHP